MTKSIKEKERLKLVRKIRESNFEFFDPEAVKIKIRYSNSNEVKAYYKNLNKNQFKTMLKNVLKDIVRQLNRFEFTIRVYMSELFTKNTYFCSLDFGRKESIGTLIIETSQNIEGKTNFNIQHFNQQITNHDNLEAFLSIVIFNYSGINENKEYKKDIIKTMINCNLFEHFSMIKNFIDKLKYECNFDICSHYTGVRNFGFKYIISNTTYYSFDFRYKLVLSKRQVESRSIFDLYYPAVNNEAQLLECLIQHKLFPEELDDIYEDLSIEQIIEHTKMALY